MTENVRIEGTLMTASVADRTVTCKLLPYGEPGRTSIGLVTASKGVMEVPADPKTVRLNVEHDRKRPIGYATAFDDQDDAMYATFHVAATRAGDDFLVEAAEGLRPGVSVETEGTAVRAGRMVAGRLSWVGAVSEPAFPSALMVASDHGDLPDPDDTDSTTAPGDPVEEQTEGEEPDEKEEADVPENTMNASATVPAGSRAATKNKAPEVGKGDLFRMLATAHQEGGQQRMLAALSDIVPANILGQEQPQYVGELWNGKAYQRRIVPLFNHADLTSYEVTGWRWVTKPAVAPYSGNKADVPSNPVATEQVKIAAERIAGAHDIDRKFRDFNDTAFFEAYFAAMTESYAQVSDAQVLADILAAAGTPVPVGTVPTGVSRGMTMIVDGALAVLENTKATPSFALAHPGLYRDIVLTRSEDTLAYLNAALGLEEGTVGSFKILPEPSLTAGQALVGVSSAATVHELGTVPIRVEAQDIARGGIDEGVFGYYAVNVHDAGGLVLVDDGQA